MSLYEIFYNTGYGSDITVKYGNMELKVHKNILIKHSGYFEAMIPHCQDIIDMSISDIDFDPVWLEKLIESWYSGYLSSILCIHDSFLEYYRYLKMWKFLICNGDFPCLLMKNYSVENRYDSMGIYDRSKYKYIELDTVSLSNFINKTIGFKFIKNVVKLKSKKRTLYINFSGSKNSISLDLSSGCYSCSIEFSSFVPDIIELLESQEIYSP